jgi:hypothetical protein
MKNNVQSGVIDPFVLEVLRHSHPKALNVTKLISKVRRLSDLPAEIATCNRENFSFLVKEGMWRLLDEGLADLTPSRNVLFRPDRQHA